MHAGGPEAAIPSPREAASALPPMPSMPGEGAGLPGLDGSGGGVGAGRGGLADSLESVASLDDGSRRRRGFAGRPRAKVRSCTHTHTCKP